MGCRLWTLYGRFGWGIATIDWAVSKQKFSFSYIHNDWQSNMFAIAIASLFFSVIRSLCTIYQLEWVTIANTQRMIQSTRLCLWKREKKWVKGESKAAHKRNQWENFCRMKSKNQVTFCVNRTGTFSSFPMWMCVHGLLTSRFSLYWTHSALFFSSAKFTYGRVTRCYFYFYESFRVIFAASIKYNWCDWNLVQYVRC